MLRTDGNLRGSTFRQGRTPAWRGSSFPAIESPELSSTEFHAQPASAGVEAQEQRVDLIDARPHAARVVTLPTEAALKGVQLRLQLPYSVRGSG